MSKVWCTVTFVDGTTTKLVWEKKSELMNAATLIEKVLASKTFTVEVEGRLLVMPMNNIRTIEVGPSPDKLPDTVVRGARLA